MTNLIIKVKINDNKIKQSQKIHNVQRERGEGYVALKYLAFVISFLYPWYWYYFVFHNCKYSLGPDEGPFLNRKKSNSKQTFEFE